MELNTDLFDPLILAGAEPVGFYSRSQVLELLAKHGAAKTLPPTGFIRQNKVLELVPWSKSTLWARIGSGRFPQPVALGPRIVGWRVESVLAYIENARRIHPNGSTRVHCHGPPRD